MIVVSFFTISGFAITSLLVAKKWGEKRRKPFLILYIISKGDIRIRGLYHQAVHLYSEGKERVLFFFKKQISIHFRNSLNKLLTFLRTKREQYLVTMRDSKLLKKSDGISEFFKNMSNIEKGNGEINDVYEDTSPNDHSVGRGSQDNKKELN